MKDEERVNEIFYDAKLLYEESLKELEEGKIRDAAEKAWGATLRATNALILAKTGEEPQNTSITSKRLRTLSMKDDKIDKLVGRYYTRQSTLHGECFYVGLCEPKEDIERRIRETDRYIEDAKKLAGVDEK